MKFKRFTALISAAAVLGSVFTAASAADADNVTGDFVLASPGYAAQVYVDPDGSEYDGLSLIAEAFAKDVESVSGEKPEIVTDAADLTGIPVIAGAVGENDGGLISSIVESGKVDVSAVEGTWETYTIRLVENPTENIEKALVIIGSDKRGTIYGIFHISEMIGVSPWVYYGDVTPEHKDSLVFSADELSITSKEPSVKYRGVFLNDESPCLTSWTDKAFGGRNYKFYETMFEVILRLKGNYLWPAMWGNEFSKDGLDGISDSDKTALASAELADKYGIVMGTSHHEPMCRAGNEWGQEYKNYLTAEDAEKGSADTWDYFNYGYAIKEFWKDGYNRNKDFENLVTVGMRGEADSSLGLSLSDSVQNLKNVITDQMDIMKESSGDVPDTTLCLYKEVEEYWYGGYDEDGNYVEGLKDWKVDGSNPLDDTNIMLCDDNFGNLRTVPTEDERNRPGGWGMYYHFDYVGGPHNYKWIATNQLEKTWENMTAAYDYGIQNVWVVNVGDFKPMELNISFFLDLAYDMDKWGEVNSAQEYYSLWAEQQFGYACDDETTEAIAQILRDYLKMNGARKPEKMFPSTFSLTDYNEAQTQLAKANDLYDRAWKYYDMVPSELKDAYYQLVLYPAAASANIERWCVYSALNSMYAEEGSMLANKYAALVDECYNLDVSLQKYYNKEMSGGKWDGMQSRELHIGYNNWNSSYDNPTSYVEPRGEYIAPADDEADKLIVNTDTSKTAAKPEGTEISLNSLYKETRAVTVSHSRSGSFSYGISADKDWIKLSKTSGTVYTGDVIGVSVDWSALSASDTGTVTITGLDSTVTITVKADVQSVSGISEKTVMPKNGTAAVLAEDYSAIGGDWILMENYGREKSSMKAADFTADYTADDAPYLEYKVYAPTSGVYYLTAYTAPTNNRADGGRLPYGVAVNGGDVDTVYTLPENFDVGNASLWSQGCINNARITTSEITLNEGENTIRFLSLESGTVLQKLVVSESGTLSSAAFGAIPTYIVGNTVEQQPLESYCAEDICVVPGTVEAGTEDIVVSKTAPYAVNVNGTVSEDAVISIMLNGEEIAKAEYDSEKGICTGATEDEITAGEYRLTYKTENGTADITSIELVSNDGMSKIEVLNNGFDNESEAAGYVPYTDGDGTITYSNGKLIESGFESGWNQGNGIKTDVTDLVKGASGMKFGASADVYSTASGASALFIEVVAEDGTKTTYNFASSSEYVDGSLSLKGETEGVSFGADDKVYLCVTQWSGYTSFDNIKLWYYAGKTTEEFFSNDFSDESQIDGYSPYDADREPTEFEVNNGYLKVSNEDGWNSANGIRKDVTAYVKGHSGAVFGASADFTCWYYGSSPVKIFFEVVSADGTVSQETIATAQTADAENGTKIEGIEGETALVFEDTDTVYLCITHNSGTHLYDNIRLWGTYVSSSDGDAAKKVNIFKHTFNADKAAETAMYEPYEENGGTVSGGANPVLKYENGDGATAGVKINVTDNIGLSTELSGKTFGASANVKPAYSWTSSNNVKLFFEVVGKDGAVTQIPLVTAAPPDYGTMEITDSETGVSLGNNWLEKPAEGTGVLTFGEDDTVYLCITSTNSPMWLDDITMYYEADEDAPIPTTEPTPTMEPSTTTEPTPSPTPSPTTEPTPTPTAEPKLIVYEPIMNSDGKTASMTVTNTTDKNVLLNIYAAEYGDDGALVKLTKTVESVPAESGTRDITIEAAVGNKVYVWDDDMKPYIETVTLEAAAWNPSWGCALLNVWENNLPRTTLEAGTVLRQSVTLSGGGEKLRLELSNLYGNKALDIAEVHIASPAEEGVINSKIDISTDTALTFGGETGVSIPAGESVYCDPVSFKAAARGKLVITMKLGNSVPYQPAQYSSQVTGHGGARTSSYIGKDIDVSASSMAAEESIESWYYISNIDVMQNTDSHTIVCFGDSITDGYGCITNKDTRWSDYLANAINDNGLSGEYSVINRGIGGNAVASGGIGERGIDRFNRDVLGTANAEYVLVLEGVNDIGGATDAADGKSRADAVIEGFKGFIEKSHANGIKIYGATITPVGGNGYYTEVEEECRNRINDWIKENTNTVKPGEEGYDSAKYDGYLDFETLLADPDDPTKLLDEYSTDYLHPSPKGYEKMGRYAYETLFGKAI